MKQQTKQQKIAKRMRIFGFGVLGVFGLGAVLATMAMSNSVREISKNTISKTPDAILANSAIDETNEISLPVAYFDQRMDKCLNFYDSAQREAMKKRQFEWASCGYYNNGIEQGLVGYQLNDKYLPVAVGGELTSNRGLSDITHWFTAVDGKSKNYSGVIKLAHKAEGAVFSYSNETFYPIDEVKFSENDSVNGDGHNHLFTMDFAVPFTVLASGSEKFEITADDDTFVFVGNELAVDMGGIHDATTGRIEITENGEVYSSILGEETAFSGITVNQGESAIIRIFHADRNSSESVMKMEFAGMDLNVMNTSVAGNDDGSVQIAYDPNDPTFVAPLGETLTTAPNNTKGFMVMAIIEGGAIVLMAIFAAVIARAMLKNRV